MRKSLRVFEKKVAAIISLFLIAETDQLIAQSFLDPIDDPFGLKYDSNYLTLDIDMIDIDNDGDLDFFSFGFEYGADEVGYIYAENIGTAEVPEFGSTLFSPFGNIQGEYENLFGDFADIDKDGDLDIVVPTNTEDGYLSGLAIYENIGDAQNPNFQLSDSVVLELLLEGNQILNFNLVDIDGDGDDDFLAGATAFDYDTYTYENVILYAENISQGKNIVFAPVVHDPFGLSTSQTAVFLINDFADIDGDGDFDLLLTSIEYDAVLEDLVTDFTMFRNDGNSDNPQFSIQLSGLENLDLPIGDALLPFLADLDNDGDSDIIAVFYEGVSDDYTIQFYENDELSGVSKPLLDPLQLNIFPNPTVDLLNLDFREKQTSFQNILLTCYDQLGRIYHQEKLINVDRTIGINTKSWQNGTYVLKLETDQGIFLKTFIKY